MSLSSRNKPSKVFVSRAGWYSLRYPREWELEEDENYVALYEPEKGVGALHVSAYETPGPADPKKEMLDHLSDNETPVKAEDITVRLNGTKEIASFEQVNPGSFQKTWFVSDNGYLVLATYDSNAEDRDKELGEVENIINSIEVGPKFSRN